MSKIRISKTATAATIDKKKRREWPVVVYLWAFGLALVSYAVARVVLDGLAHPYHWGGGIAGGLFGIGIGWLWYRWRGDIL
jgi:CHASE2 domain-containing sensor protein